MRNRTFKSCRLFFLLATGVLVSGCASLDERLISNDIPTRKNAVKKLQSMSTDKRKEHLVILVRQLGSDSNPNAVACHNVNCTDQYTPYDVSLLRTNILNTLTALGASADSIAPYLVNVYSCCQYPAVRKDINDALISIVGMNKAENLRSKYATNKVTALINKIEETATPTADGRIARFRALAQLYEKIIFAIEPMTPKDKALISIDAVMKPALYSRFDTVHYPVIGGNDDDYRPSSCPECIIGPTSTFVKTLLALLIKIGPTAIPALQQWLAHNMDETSTTSNAVIDALKQIGTPEALGVIVAWRDDLAKKKKQVEDEQVRRHREALADAEARSAQIAAIRAAQVRERKEILKLEPREDFRQVLEVIYDSQQLQGISASHYKRTAYKNGVKYSINVGPQNGLNTDIYIIPTKREDVFRVRFIHVESLSYYAWKKRLGADEDRMVNATPGMAEYLGVTGIIDLATGVTQWQ